MKRFITGAIAAVAFGSLFGSSVVLAQDEPVTPPPAPPTQQQSLQEEPCPPGVGGAGTMTTTTTVTQEQHGINQVNPLGVMILGGVEGYSGVLAPRLNAGVSWGAAAFYEPWKVLGFELGYSGGVAYLKNNVGGGADVVRNGGYVIATPGLTFPMDSTERLSLKPYLLGGIGLDGWNAENGGPAAGWHNTTNGNVPFGGGLELRADHVVANARFNYVWGFGDQFNPYTSEPLRYQGLVSVGGAF
jgi:hypothetical protein